MDIKKLLAIIAGGLAVVSFFAGSPAVLLAVGIILLAVSILI
jgi:hypothetical protein